jgi:hypothetical protein
MNDAVIPGALILKGRREAALLDSTSAFLFQYVSERRRLTFD